MRHLLPVISPPKAPFQPLFGRHSLVPDARHILARRDLKSRRTEYKDFIIRQNNDLEPIYKTGLSQNKAAQQA